MEEVSEEKKAERYAAESSKNKQYQNHANDQAKNPVGRKLFSPKKTQTKTKIKEEEQAKEDEFIIHSFDSGSYGGFNVPCYVVYVLPREYDCMMEVAEIEDCEEEELAKHKPMCYFVMNNGCIREKNVFFERSHEGMKNHIKPLFIRVKVEGTIVNKILLDGGAAVNLMPHFLLAKIRRFDTYLRPHNMVLSKYEGKNGTTMGVIQVDITVGSITQPTVFLVITSRANYNLLIGQEWIHGIRVVPSSIHQRIEIWREKIL